jgi:hypothetical protein
MTRMIRIITVAGVALVLAPSAFAQTGERFQEAPQWHQALMARSEGMNQRYQAQSTTPVVGERFQKPSQWLLALEARSEALNRQNGLGEYAVSAIDARERALTAKSEAQMAVTPYPDWFERAANTAIRDNRGVVVGDDHFNLRPEDISATATSSGREVDFPKIGIGVALGLMLVLALYFAFRGPRLGRPLAH